MEGSGKQPSTAIPHEEDGIDNMVNSQQAETQQTNLLVLKHPKVPSTPHNKQAIMTFLLMPAVLAADSACKGRKAASHDVRGVLKTAEENHDKTRDHGLGINAMCLCGGARETKSKMEIEIKTNI